MILIYETIYQNYGDWLPPEHTISIGQNIADNHPIV